MPVETAPAAVTVTVPLVPADASPWKSWRKILTGLDESCRGAYAVQGTFAEPGDRIAVSAGILLLSVDQRHVRWDSNHETGERYAVMSAEVTLYLASADGQLKLLWNRSFAQAKSAAGPAALRQMRKHLNAHPVPPGMKAEVLEEGPGIPNLDEAPCAWCGSTVSKNSGRVRGRGDTARVTHAPGGCPAQRVEDGTACDRCGITMASRQGSRRIVIDGPGRARWVTAHYDYLRCTDGRPPPSWEQQAKEAEAAAGFERAEREKAKTDAVRKEAARKRREEKRREKEKAARAAAEAEEARVRALTRTNREASTLYDKGLGGGWRARLEECRDTLSDGTAAVCWRLTTYQETMLSSPNIDGEYDDLPCGGREDEYWYLPDARFAYRQMRWSPEGPSASRRPPSTRMPCPGPDVPHCDNCGASAPEPGGWMSASLGRACGVDCYDAMADAEGTHARRCH